jgi:DNA-binding transcriptional MerR regulator
MTPTIDDRATTVSPAEAARRLGVQVGTLRNWRWRQVGPPHTRVGARIRYRLVDLAEWLDGRARASTSALAQEVSE